MQKLSAACVEQTEITACAQLQIRVKPNKNTNNPVCVCVMFVCLSRTFLPCTPTGYLISLLGQQLPPVSACQLNILFAV